MTAPQVLILRAPGTNCDAETAFAFEQVGAVATVSHVNRIFESPQRLANYQILCFPGGFSYGDDIAAGRILANLMHYQLHEPLQQFKNDGKLILGICNGFQVLMKSGLLFDFDSDAPEATLTWNDSGQFEDRWVHLQRGNTDCVFLNGIERMYLPMAHAEGKFVPRDPATLQQLQAAGQCALRYVTAEGDNPTAMVNFPDNPNGSIDNIAGLCDRSGRVFGLMPHPERYIDPTHHPHWTRQTELPPPDGLAVFHNAVQYFA